MVLGGAVLFSLSLYVAWCSVRLNEVVLKTWESRM